MNDDQKPTLQVMVEYYRNKSYQLEYEYLLYKIQSENIIKKLQTELDSFKPKE